MTPPTHSPTARRIRNPFSEGAASRRKHLLQDLLLLLFGALCQAFAYAVFIAPAGIVPGGVYGISITINHLTKGLLSLFPMGYL